MSVDTDVKTQNKKPEVLVSAVSEMSLAQAATEPIPPSEVTAASAASESAGEQLSSNSGRPVRSVLRTTGRRLSRTPPHARVRVQHALEVQRRRYDPLHVVQPLRPACAQASAKKARASPVADVPGAAAAAGDAAVTPRDPPFSPVAAADAAPHVCDRAGVCKHVCVLSEVYVNAVCTGVRVNAMRVGSIPKLQVYMGAVPAVAGKDTGAGLSCMNAAFLAALEQRGVRFTRSPVTRRVRGANNSPLVCHGTVTVPLRVGNLSVEHDFLVIKDLCYNVLLGQDFWEQYQKGDHSAAKYFELCDGSFVPYYNVRAGHTDTRGVVSTVRAVRLPPESAQIVWCKVRHHIRRDTDGVFEPNGRQCAKGVYVSGNLCTVSESNTVPVQFLNMTSKTVVVAPFKVGTFSILDSRAEVALVQYASDVSDQFQVDTGDLPCDSDVLAQHRNTTQTLGGESAVRARESNPSAGVDSSQRSDGIGREHSSCKPNPQARVMQDGENIPRNPNSNSSSPSLRVLPPGFSVPQHPDMTPEFQGMIEDMVARTFARGAFSKFPGEIGKTSLLEAQLDTVDEQPVQAHYVRMDQVRQEACGEIVRDMHAQQLLRESTSAYRSPVLLVKKPNGKWRFVNDFRALNAKLKPVHFPLPRVDESLDAVRGNTWFATADLSSGYWNVEIAEKDRHKTAFSVPGIGNFEYNRLPMGIASSAVYFQKLMSMVLQGLSMNVCIPYLDDILIVAKSLPELVERCETIFNRIADAGLKLNPAKTIIGSRQIKFLGFIVSKDGMTVSEEHITKVLNWPVPETVKGVRRFYGLCNYLRKYIADFAQVAKPLSDLMGERGCKRIDNTDPAFLEAFKTLKERLVSPPILAYPDFSADAKPFHVKPDACKIACGATLTQEQHGQERVIAYASYSFSGTQRRWPISEKESYAIWWAITKEFRPYVYGREFEVFTDHKPCLAMRRNKVVNERMLRMALSLNDYHFTMHYKSGETHEDADAMSRLQEALEERIKGNDVDCPCMDCAKERARSNATSAKDITTTSAGAHTSVTVNSLIADGEVKVMPIELDADSKPTAATLECDTSELVSTFRKLAEKGFYPLNISPDKYPSELPMELRILAVSGAGYQPKAVRFAQQEDPHVKRLYRFLKGEEKALAGEMPKRKYRIVARECEKLYLADDIVYRNEGFSGRQLYVPERLKRELLEQFHASKPAGHMGVYRTYAALSRNYYWPGMRQDALNFVRGCKECAMRNVSPRQRVRARQQVDVPHIFERVAIDYQGPFTESEEGHTHVLNFMCLNTGWVEGVCVKANELDAKLVARTLVEKVILHWGPPRAILSDRGSQFLAAVVRETMKIFGIAKLTASAYHPQSNGKLERVHRTLNNIIAKIVDTDHRKWEMPYRFALHAYRTTANSVYGDTPYFLVFGRDCTDFADVSLFPAGEHDPIATEIPDAQTRKWFVEWRAQLVRNVEHSRRRLTEMMREEQLLFTRDDPHGDKLPREYEVGDRVYVREYVKTPGLTKKWLGKFLPVPYRVVEKVQESGGLSFTLRACNEPVTAPTINRSVDDLKPFYEYFVLGDQPETVLLRDKNKELVKVPQAADNSDLPIEGQSHGWNNISGDEVEITKIIAHHIEAVKGGVPVVRFRVSVKSRKGDDERWVKKEDLRAPYLLADYERRNPDMYNPDTWGRRPIRSNRKLAVIGLLKITHKYQPGVIPGRHGANLTAAQRRARRRTRLACACPYCCKDRASQTPCVCTLCHTSDHA